MLNKYLLLKTAKEKNVVRSGIRYPPASTLATDSVARERLPCLGQETAQCNMVPLYHF